MIDDSVPSNFQPGYVHHKKFTCHDCHGRGIYEVAAVTRQCQACDGTGSRETCGGPAELDEHYGVANCLSCGHIVPREELSKA